MARDAPARPPSVFGSVLRRADVRGVTASSGGLVPGLPLKPRYGPAGWRGSMRRTFRWSVATALGVMLLSTMAYANPKKTQTVATLGPPQSPVIVRVEPTPKEVEAVAQQLATDREIAGQSPEFWLVLFSGALTVVTVLVFVATRQAARAGEVAALQTLELERPHVFVRYGEPGLEERLIEITNSTHGDIETKEVARYKGPLKYLLVNFGRSPAVLTEIYEDYLWLDGQHDFPSVLDLRTTKGEKQVHGTVTANGDPFGISRRPSLVFGKGKGRLQQDTFKNDSFFIRGFVRYRDVVGNKYLLVYCAKFDRGAVKFLPINDERYNYSQIIKPWSLRNPLPHPENL
jgi:hypothetical protein